MTPPTDAPITLEHIKTVGKAMRCRTFDGACRFCGFTIDSAYGGNHYPSCVVGDTAQALANERAAGRQEGLEQVAKWHDAKAGHYTSEALRETEYSSLTTNAEAMVVIERNYATAIRALKDKP